MARFEVDGVTADTTELVATDEWEVNTFVPTGTNLGLEGISYVPDAFLVASGWRVDGVAYAASDYPTPGLFVTAVEGTGALHFFSLERGAAPVEVKVESSGFPWSMDVAYDADRAALWALCDDGCGGVYNLLTVTDGDFQVAHSYARPAGMPNLNNEGMAIAPASTCVDGFQTVVWADDGDTGGHSLRAGTLACPEAETGEPGGETDEPGGEDEPTPGTWATVDVGTGEVTRGGSLAVRLSGLEPGQQITATLHSDPIVIDGIPAADASGSIAFNVAIPAEFELGAHTLVIETAGEEPISVPVTVLAPAGGDLASTGVELPWMALLAALVLLACGLLLVRMRRGQHPEA